MRKQADYIASTSNKFFPRKCGTVEERFWSKVMPEPNTGCYIANKRPYVPRSVRIAVLLRQCGELGIAAPQRDPFTDGEYIKKIQVIIFGNESVHLDHDPSLVNRDFDEDLRLYSPDANDPRFLVYRTKEEHRIKTFVRGLHGQHSDLALARKRKRKERKAKRPKRKWPSRPFARTLSQIRKK